MTPYEPDMDAHIPDPYGMETVQVDLSRVDWTSVLPYGLDLPDYSTWDLELLCSELEYWTTRDDQIAHACSAGIARELMSRGAL